jgi:hypothetical protein
MPVRAGPAGVKGAIQAGSDLTRARLGGELVFVDEAAESVPATEPIERDGFARSSIGCWRRLGERRPLLERAVRPVLVVMRCVRGDDAFEVAASEDQQPVEAFAAEAPDPALGMALAPAAPAGAP